MLTKEEYKKEYIRMMDSARNECKGADDCKGVVCKDCPIHLVCDCTSSNQFEVIEAVEKWSKDHPIITNAEKFKEVFGFGVSESCCIFRRTCDTCEFFRKGCSVTFWNSEYKEPKEGD